MAVIYKARDLRKEEAHDRHPFKAVMQWSQEHPFRALSPPAANKHR
jgi:hypothetical protein